MKEPLVSIIIPTYKRSKYIERTIEAVLKQSYNNIEIIVVDDNNPETYHREETEKVMQKYRKHKNIKYIKHEKNMNGCAARNTGLKAAEGKYICFLDDDDIIYENKIKEQVEFLEKNLKYGAVYCYRKIGDLIHCPNIEGNISEYLLSGEHIIITIMLLFRKCNIKDCEWNINLKRNQEAGFLLEFFDKGNLIACLPKILCETYLDDRSNVLNSKKNEYEMLKYLNEYKRIIEKNGYNKGNIYCQRYFGIMLTYLKDRKILNFIRCFFKTIFFNPFLFIKISFNYVKNYLEKERKDYKRYI